MVKTFTAMEKPFTKAKTLGKSFTNSDFSANTSRFGGYRTACAQGTSPGDETDQLRLRWIPIRTMGSRLGRLRCYLYANSAPMIALTETEYAPEARQNDHC